MARSEFEREDIERFLDHYYSWKDTNLVLDLEQRDYPRVREAMKAGLEQGLDEYLRDHGSATVYTVDFHNFFGEEGIERRVRERLEEVAPGLEYLDALSLDVAKTYHMFILNESLERCRQLKHEDDPRSD